MTNKNEFNEKEDELYNAICLSSEYEKCNFLSRLIYLWNWQFFLKNYKKEISIKDVPKGRKIDETNYIYNEFFKYFNTEIKRSIKNKRNPNLIYPIFHQYGLQLILLGLICLFMNAATLYQALYLDDLIKNFNNLNDNNDKQSINNIIFSFVQMIICAFIGTNLRSIFDNYTRLISIRVRACLSQFIYRKSLLLSKNGLDNTSTGQIVNLLSTDMNRIDSIFSLLPIPFVAFVLLFLAIFKLWKYLSYYTFYGILFLCFAVPIQSAIGNLVSRLRKKAADFTDERMRLVNEFINAIKFIKLYCLELHFSKKIEEARKKEINLIERSYYFYAITTGLLATSSKIVVFIILTVFYFSGGKIDERVIFLTLSIFSQVTFLFTIFMPHFILTASNFMISMKRINKFLLLEERNQLINNDSQLIITNGNDLEMDKILISNTECINENQTYSLEVKNLIACYSTNKNLTIGLDNPNYLDDKSEKLSNKNINVLNNINFYCKSCELIIVVGAVGSGKSSLLQAILSELKIAEGGIYVNGRLSYSSQEPWIFSGTIKENIIFDSEFNQDKYNKIIKVCALERDLTLFQDGDQTLIGERGVTLSGGQKARINLARSLYFDADIYLLDDPLSSVDTHVAKHIFKQAIKDYLKDKIVILVTHQLNYVKYADKILFIKDGEQIFFNQSRIVMKKLIDEQDSEFAKFIGQKNEEKQYSEIESNSIEHLSKTILTDSNSSLDKIESSSLYDKIEFVQLKKEFEKTEKEKRLKEEDDKAEFVSKSYLSYFKYGKFSIYGPLVLLVFSLSQFFASSSDYLLKIWSDSIKENKTSDLIQSTNRTFIKIPNENNINLTIKFIYDNSVYIYSSLIILFFFTSLIRTMIFNMFGMTTSKNIHKHLFKRIVNAKMIFFYQSSVAIILNRFSKDIGCLDNDVIFAFHDFLEITINNFVILIIMVISNPFLIIPYLILIILIITFRNFYIKTARSLDTLEGVSKSPILQHLTVTLHGLTTLRAFKKENRFIKKFEIAQNDHISIQFATHICKTWFSYMLNNFQIIFISICFLILTTLANLFSGSLIGLLVTYILQSSDFFWAIICWTNLETYLCAVDRIEKMAKNLDDDKSSLSESALLESIPECKPPENWPKNTRIVFNNVTMRYFKGEEPVLKNLKFTIEEKQKIGIVGRTGAGKSSIVSALFRLTDYEGDITIDNVNCKSIGLHDLRSKISIIPQEPVIFTGTIRSNLDPTEQFNDDKLWNSLKAVQLDQVVKELEGGLDSKVNDNGGNFSVGQKQLICLARAILKENKILVLDEATANCDPKTDSLIQNTIRNTFKDCTILTIAHRLDTIMDSTKILVLDAGELIEFDKPLELIKNKDSLFRDMIYSNGDEKAKNLIKIAEDNCI